MKALFVAVALLAASSSLAQSEAEKQGTAQGAELRRPPPPGRPMPMPHQQPQSQPPPRAGNQAVVDRDELNARLARLERLLEEAQQRLEKEVRYNDRDRRNAESVYNKLRRAEETLDSVQQFVAEAPHLGAVYPAPQPPPPPPPVVRPMPEGPFKRLNEAVARESFVDDKMRIIHMAVGDNYFLISQVSQLIGHFSFSKDKLSVVSAVKPRILDPENGYQLYSAFSFSSDKKRLQDILAQR